MKPLAEGSTSGRHRGIVSCVTSSQMTGGGIATCWPTLFSSTSANGPRVHPGDQVEFPQTPGHFNWPFRMCHPLHSSRSPIAIKMEHTKSCGGCCCWETRIHTHTQDGCVNWPACCRKQFGDPWKIRATTNVANTVFKVHTWTLMCLT